VTTRGAKLLLGLGLLVLVLAAGAAAAVAYLRDLGVFGGSDPGKEISIVVPTGATAAEIGELLERKGVISSALGFRIAAFMEGGAEKIQAGRHEIRQGLAPKDALTQLIASGVSEPFVTVTFPEGAWLTEFAERLEQDTHISGKAFLDVATSGAVRSKLLPRDVKTLEGLLFPSTYQVVRSDNARSLVERLVNETEERVAELGTSSLDALGVSPYEAVIVASMVEAEAKVEEDRGRIAAVIYNRLEQGMRLGIDATVIYALGQRSKTLTQSDLAIDSPFNTREVAGLPPTPIGAPGAESLQAAFHPARGRWLYYVLSDCAGNHAFSETYDAFLADKADYETLTC
jgi:UPF0755 protein